MRKTRTYLRSPCGYDGCDELVYSVKGRSGYCRTHAQVARHKKALKTIGVRIDSALRLDTTMGQTVALSKMPNRKMKRLLADGYGARFVGEKTIRRQRYAVFELIHVDKKRRKPA